MGQTDDLAFSFVNPPVQSAFASKGSGGDELVKVREWVWRTLG